MTDNRASRSCHSRQIPMGNHTSCDFLQSRRTRTSRQPSPFRPVKTGSSPSIHRASWLKGAVQHRHASNATRACKYMPCQRASDPSQTAALIHSNFHTEINRPQKWTASRLHFRPTGAAVQSNAATTAAAAAVASEKRGTAQQVPTGVSWRWTQGLRRGLSAAMLAAIVALEAANGGAADARPRLTQDEQLTVNLFKDNTPSVVFITNLAVRHASSFSRGKP